MPHGKLELIHGTRSHFQRASYLKMCIAGATQAADATPQGDSDARAKANDAMLEMQKTKLMDCFSDEFKNKMKQPQDKPKPLQPIGISEPK